MIELKNAIHKYTSFSLGPISLEIKLGEFISVVGPSGSGKSTLIKVLTGNNKLTSGTIEYIDSQADDIMYIPQIGTTFNHLSIRDNLCLKYTYSDQQIKECLLKVGLDQEFIEKYPFELSGGERQRIDIVRAILSQSKYIVLDESMSALDGENKQAISSLLKSFVKMEQMTIIYITHDITQAIDYSTRIIALNHGKITFDGTSSEYINIKDGE